MFEPDYHPDALTVKVSELLVATADRADALIDDSVQQVLMLLREQMNRDVVFVSEFTGNRRVIRQVATGPGDPVIAAGQSDPLETSWCQRVVDGRLPEYIANTAALPEAAALTKDLPFTIGTHISTPIVLQDGEVYGTLCSFSFHAQDTPNPEDLRRLQFSAKLTAGRIDKARAGAPQSFPKP
jgi:GAF domain-containing protein